MTPSYMESPTASPVSPMTIILPFCIMKPVRKPESPPTTSVPPFMEMPARAPALRPTKTSPPLILAATDAPASPVNTILPLIKFSPRAHPELPSIVIEGPSSRLAE